jgi:hypothetical protein
MMLVRQRFGGHYTSSQRALTLQRRGLETGTAMTERNDERLALLLGPILLQSSRLEEYMTILLAELQPTGLPHGWIDRTLGQKIAMALDAEKAKPNPELKTFLEDCRNLKDERNAFVHGTYASIDSVIGKLANTTFVRTH